jgi:choline dehydrogenase-like flavoprotein
MASIASGNVLVGQYPVFGADAERMLEWSFVLEEWPGMEMVGEPKHNVVVIGSGFGGTMTALSIGRAFRDRKRGETVHILERGTWWTTPVATVQDIDVRTPEHLKKNGQRAVQYWPSVDHASGLLDIIGRCFKRESNPDGLFDITEFGAERTGLFARIRRALLGLKKSDGLRIVHASGVGGGSLVYSNVTIRPPEPLFGTAPWQHLTWDEAERNTYYELARQAIGYGVLFALDRRPNAMPPNADHGAAGAVNTGLSNIVARTAGLKPTLPPAANLRDDVKKLPLKQDKKDTSLWIDRARVFQTTMEEAFARNGLSPKPDEWGTVDSSINDLPPASIPPDQRGANPPNLGQPLSGGKNYCQRMGRCTVGCLPGARHTLNKQLMKAMFGPADNTVPGHTPLVPPPPAPPQLPAPKIDLKDTLSLTALAEVSHVEAAREGAWTGYRVHYTTRDPDDPGGKPTRQTMLADKVILAAGVVGTVEILLRSRDEKKTLPHISDALGGGFSTNGDYIGFVQRTKEPVHLIKGPVTTSYAFFNRDKAPGANDAGLFHTVEDNGIPPALASNLDFGLDLAGQPARRNGVGAKLAESVRTGSHRSRWMVTRLWLRLATRRLVDYVRNVFRERADRTEDFISEDEHMARTMCITAFGHAQLEGKFRLGTPGKDTPLRIDCVNGRSLAEDPIYTEIEHTAAENLSPLFTDSGEKFSDPFVSPALKAKGQASLMITHPLGGAVIGPLDAASPSGANDTLLVFDPGRKRAGVVDEYGRVYDVTKRGSQQPFYDGLYVADASVIPSALGVNPSLTISAIALRIADKLIANLPP